ncbi:hypothetical protein [Parvivirga hydrogeniphila]|nr:hypothetical protein [Parvivirga hydrogeniphila]
MRSVFTLTPLLLGIIEGAITVVPGRKTATEIVSLWTSSPM